MLRGEIGGLDAILFDLDGTLVDSMTLHFEAYRTAIASLAGEELGRADFDRAVGGSYREAIPLMLRARDEKDTRRGGQLVERIHDAKLDVYAELLETTEIPVLPTARLLGLGELLPLALVTSGARAGVDLVLRRLGWSELFVAVVTSDDIGHGKPDAEPYSLAVRKLGVNPGRCLAFEDTDAGVASARGAGIDVVDVRSAGAS